MRVKSMSEKTVYIVEMQQLCSFTFSAAFIKWINCQIMLKQTHNTPSSNFEKFSYYCLQCTAIPFYEFLDFYHPSKEINLNLM
jgi:hypothetical protein